MPARDMDFLQKVFTAAITGPLEYRGVNWVKGQSYLSDFLKKRKHKPRQDDIVDTILHFEFPDGTPYTDADRAVARADRGGRFNYYRGCNSSGAILILATHQKTAACSSRILPSSHALSRSSSGFTSPRPTTDDESLGTIKIAAPNFGDLAPTLRATTLFTTLAVQTVIPPSLSARRSSISGGILIRTSVSPKDSIGA